MNNKFVICKEKAVALDFPRRLDDLLLLLRGEGRHVINELPGIFRIWYNEAKLEFIVPENTTSEVVSLNHLHLLNRLPSNSKIESKPNCLQF